MQLMKPLGQVVEAGVVRDLEWSRQLAKASLREGEGGVDDLLLFEGVAFPPALPHIRPQLLDRQVAGRGELVAEGEREGIFFVGEVGLIAIGEQHLSLDQAEHDLLLFEVEFEGRFAGGDVDADGIAGDGVAKVGINQPAALDTAHRDDDSTLEIGEVVFVAEDAQEDIFHGGEDDPFDVGASPGDDLVGEVERGEAEEGGGDEGGGEHDHHIDARRLDGGDFVVPGESTEDDADRQQEGGGDGEGEQAGDDKGEDVADLLGPKAILGRFPDDPDDDQHASQRQQGEGEDPQQLSEDVSLQDGHSGGTKNRRAAMTASEASPTANPPR